MIWLKIDGFIYVRIPTFNCFLSTIPRSKAEHEELDELNNKFSHECLDKIEKKNEEKTTEEITTMEEDKVNGNKSTW
ncbi:hypothetical protein C1646_767591 [Rhizophagus diaphanus]|nr:hypothetical protein C1646_767591 [Rhizophagus diaphanus] [Rhizophagus sp. MUCL 43196]